MMMMSPSRAKGQSMRRSLQFHLLTLFSGCAILSSSAFSPQQKPRRRAPFASEIPSIPGLVVPERSPRVSNITTEIIKPTVKDDDDQKEDEEDYRIKLAEAERAIAAAEESRRKLARSRSDAAEEPPIILTRVKLSKSDAGTLMVELPPTGMNAQSLFAGAFGIAWFSVVLPATFSGLWLFMLPFWAAGTLVAKQAVLDPFVSSQLTIGQYAWSVKSIYGGGNKGITLNEREGATDELRGARPELVAVVNNVPQYEIRLYGAKGATSLPFGGQVSEEELQYLADKINDHLRFLRDMPESERLLGLPEN